jgi:hypothetical protein
VLNTGGVQGSYIAELKINGSVEGSQEVTLAGGASIAVNFDIAKDTAGEYMVDIGGQTGKFTVSEPAAGVSWSLVGGIIAAVVIAGTSAIFIFRRRRGIA